MTKQVLGYLALAIFLSGTNAVAAPPGGQQREMPPVPIETSKVLKNVYAPKLSLYGNVHAGRAATVKAEISGVVIKFDKEVGDSVDKGETVCYVDASRYGIAFEAAKGKLERAGVALEKAQLDMERAASLYEKRVAPKEKLDDAKLALRMARAEYMTIKADADYAGRNLRQTEIKAPYSGVLAGKYLQKGDWANSSEKVFDIVDLSTAYVIVSLPEKELNRIHIDMPAKIWLDAYPNSEFVGKITRISPRTSAQNRGLETRIDFKDDKNLARDGLFARVHVLPNEKMVTMVPKDAIVERGPQKIVFRINNGIAKQVEVSVINQLGNLVEVEGELAEGDEIAVTGNEILGNGAKVNVTFSR